MHEQAQPLLPAVSHMSGTFHVTKSPASDLAHTFSRQDAKHSLCLSAGVPFDAAYHLPPDIPDVQPAFGPGAPVSHLWCL